MKEYNDGDRVTWSGSSGMVKGTVVAEDDGSRTVYTDSGHSFRLEDLQESPSFIVTGRLRAR